MAGTSVSMALLLQLAAVFLLALSPVNGAIIEVVNRCLREKTVCAASLKVPIDCSYVLNGGGGRRTIDVGGEWEAGLIWAFDGNSGSESLGNAAKPQANLAEITINSNNQDWYDISNVNAYNLPMTIAVTKIAGGVTPSGTRCTSIVCNIPNNELAAFCQTPNRLTGPPGNGCYNTDGTGNVATPGTRAFRTRCPTSYSYSKDDQGSVFSCSTGSDYQVVFCPE